MKFKHPVGVRLAALGLASTFALSVGAAPALAGTSIAGLTITKSMDKASSEPVAPLKVRTAGGPDHEYMIIKMEEALVS
jgi:type VI protein secretion system component Hcp